MSYLFLGIISAYSLILTEQQHVLHAVCDCLHPYHYRWQLIRQSLLAAGCDVPLVYKASHGLRLAVVRRQAIIAECSLVCRYSTFKRIHYFNLLLEEVSNAVIIMWITLSLKNLSANTRW